MSGCEHKVFGAVDKCAFLLCVCPPEYEDKVLALFGEYADGGVGKGFPALALVRACLMGAYGKGGVEQQYALFCPAGEVA